MAENGGRQRDGRQSQSGVSRKGGGALENALRLKAVRERWEAKEKALQGGGERSSNVFESTPSSRHSKGRRAKTAGGDGQGGPRRKVGFSSPADTRGNVSGSLGHPVATSPSAHGGSTPNATHTRGAKGINNTRPSNEKAVSEQPSPLMSVPRINFYRPGARGVNQGAGEKEGAKRVPPTLLPNSEWVMSGESVLPALGGKSFASTPENAGEATTGDPRRCAQQRASTAASYYSAGYSPFAAPVADQQQQQNQFQSTSAEAQGGPLPLYSLAAIVSAKSTATLMAMTGRGAEPDNADGRDTPWQGTARPMTRASTTRDTARDNLNTNPNPHPVHKSTGSVSINPRSESLHGSVGNMGLRGRSDRGLPLSEPTSAAPREDARASLRWREVVFPPAALGTVASGKPPTRSDAVMLAEWLDGALRAVDRDPSAYGGLGTLTAAAGMSHLDLPAPGSHPDLDAVLAEHGVLSVGLHEAARQVSLHCAERGALLLDLWTRMSTVFAHAVSQLSRVRDDVTAVVIDANAAAAQREARLLDEKAREIEAIHASYASVSQVHHRLRTERDRSDALAKVHTEAREKTSQHFGTLRKEVLRLRGEVERCERERMEAEKKAERANEAMQWLEAELLVEKGIRDTDDAGEDDGEGDGEIGGDGDGDKAIDHDGDANDADRDGGHDPGMDPSTDGPEKESDRPNGPVFHFRDTLRVRLNTVRRALRSRDMRATARGRALARLDRALDDIEDLIADHRQAEEQLGLVRTAAQSEVDACLAFATHGTQTRECRVHEETEIHEREELARMRALMAGGEVAEPSPPPSVHGSHGRRAHRRPSLSTSQTSLTGFGMSLAPGSIPQPPPRQRRGLGATRKATSQMSLLSFGAAGGGGIGGGSEAGGSVHHSAGGGAGSHSLHHSHGHKLDTLQQMLMQVGECCEGEPATRTEAWAVAVLEVILLEKIESDIAAAAGGEPRTTLAAHVSEHFLDAYGHPGVAEPSLRDFLVAAETLAGTKVAAGAFSLFVRLLSANKNSSGDQLTLALTVLSHCALHPALAHFEPRMGTQLVSCLPVADAVRLVVECIFDHTERGDPRRNNLTSKVKSLAGRATVDRGAVAVFDIATLAVEEHEWLERDAQKRLVRVFAMGDTNNDKVLSLSEFTSVITAVDPASKHKCLHMFRQALEMARRARANGGRGGAQEITVDIFVAVCRRNGVGTRVRTIGLGESAQLPLGSNAQQQQQQQHQLSKSHLGNTTRNIASTTRLSTARLLDGGRSSSTTPVAEDAPLGPVTAVDSAHYAQCRRIVLAEEWAFWEPLVVACITTLESNDRVPMAGLDEARALLATARVSVRSAIASGPGSSTFEEAWAAHRELLQCVEVLSSRHLHMGTREAARKAAIKASNS